MGHDTQAVWDGVKAQHVRGPNIWKSSAPISVIGSSAVWTPPTNKIWRLQMYCIEATADVSKVTAGGVIAVALLDGALDLGLTHSFFVPLNSVTTTPGVAYSTGWVPLGGIGIPSSAVNNVLNVNLSFALATGKIRVRVGGIIESL